MPSAFNRTFLQTLLNPTLVATNAVQYTAELTLPAAAGKMGFTFFINMGRVKAAASTLTGAPEFRIEGSPSLNKSGDWREISGYSWTTTNHNVAVSAQTVTASLPAGVATIPVQAITGLGQGDQVMVSVESEHAGAEFGRVKASAGTTLILNDALDSIHTVTGATLLVTDQAEWWMVDVFPTGQQRLRVAIDLAKNTVSTGGGIVVGVVVGSLDSIG